MGVVIFIFVIAFTIVLGRHAIREGQRIESYKKFLKDMENFDKRKK